LTFKIK